MAIGEAMVSRELEQHFDQIIPGAADRSSQFLGVVQQRCQTEGLPLTLTPKEERRSKRVILQGVIQVGKTLRKGRPMTLQVYADPVGSSLQVGWQLSTDGVPDFLMGFNAVQRGQMSLDRRDSSPENVRQLSGILNAFHETVFRPVMGQLVDALQRTQGRSESGFLGA